MGSTPTPKEVSLEVFPYIRIYADGTFLRLVGTEVCPPGLHPSTSVLSKDISIPVPKPTTTTNANLSARLYIPSDSLSSSKKLPLLLYFHGGAFIIASTSDPKYHSSLNHLVSHSNSILISLDYSLVPEHPLPAAYDDSWSFLRWILSESSYTDTWLKNHADFNNIFLIGDSGGANMAHHLALRAEKSGLSVNFSGIVMIHPYFWGEEPIGKEKEDKFGKEMVDAWWKFVCPSDRGGDDPWINPFASGSCEGLELLPCEKVLVLVAEKDILRDRGRLYYDMLVKSGWKGKGEFVETEGVGHVFHIFDTECEKAQEMFKKLALFINGTVVK